MGGVSRFLSPPCGCGCFQSLCQGEEPFPLLPLHTSSQLSSHALTEGANKAKQSPDYHSQPFTRGQQCQAVCTLLLLCVCWHFPRLICLGKLLVFVQSCCCPHRSCPCRLGSSPPSLPSSSGTEQLWVQMMMMMMHRGAAKVELA